MTAAPATGDESTVADCSNRDLHSAYSFSVAAGVTGSQRSISIEGAPTSTLPCATALNLGVATVLRSADSQQIQHLRGMYSWTSANSLRGISGWNLWYSVNACFNARTNICPPVFLLTST